MILNAQTAVVITGKEQKHAFLVTYYADSKVVVCIRDVLFIFISPDKWILVCQRCYSEEK